MKRGRTITRRHFMAALGAGTLGPFLTPFIPSQAGNARPNFVFILADDVSWNDLNAMETRVLKLPISTGWLAKGSVSRTLTW